MLGPAVVDLGDDVEDRPVEELAALTDQRRGGGEGARQHRGPTLAAATAVAPAYALRDPLIHVSEPIRRAWPGAVAFGA
ncbi:hypothetical protein GCM10027076_21570 [Nocardioides montaniterrae]